MNLARGPIEKDGRMAPSKRHSSTQSKEEQGLQSPSSASISSESKKRSWGLQPEVQGELLQDIELRGGIGKVDLEALCDEREDIYGKPNTPLRRQVQNLVDRWKKKTTAKFAEVKQKYWHLPSPSPFVGKESTEANTNHTKALAATPARLSSSFLSHSRYAKKPSSTHIKFTMNNLRIDHTMKVDPSLPEMHRKVLIVPFQDHTDNGVLHNGFGIEVLGADFAMYKEGKYKAWLRTTHSVVVQFPTAPSSFLKHVLLYQRERNRLGGHSETYEVARRVVLNRLLANVSRQTYTVEFVFPEEYELSNIVFSPNSAPLGQIDPQVTPVLIPTAVNESTTLTGIVVDVCFAVTIVEEEPRVAIPSGDINQEAGQLDTLLQGMDVRPIPYSVPAVPFPPHVDDQSISGSCTNEDIEMNEDKRGQKRLRKAKSPPKQQLHAAPVQPLVSPLALVNDSDKQGDILMQGNIDVWNPELHEMSFNLQVIDDNNNTTEDNSL